MEFGKIFGSACLPLVASRKSRAAAAQEESGEYFGVNKDLSRGPFA